MDLGKAVIVESVMWVRIRSFTRVPRVCHLFAVFLEKLERALFEDLAFWLGQHYHAMICLVDFSDVSETTKFGLNALLC